MAAFDIVVLAVEAILRSLRNALVYKWGSSEVTAESKKMGEATQSILHGLLVAARSPETQRGRPWMLPGWASEAISERKGASAFAATDEGLAAGFSRSYVASSGKACVAKMPCRDGPRIRSLQFWEHSCCMMIGQDRDHAARPTHRDEPLSSLQPGRARLRFPSSE